MTSIQDALSEALEHPISEPRRPSSSKKKRSTHPPRQMSEGSSDRVWLGVLSIFGCLTGYAVYRRFRIAR